MSCNKNRNWLMAATCSLMLTSSLSSYANESADYTDEELLNMSMEEFMQVQVYSASKRPEKLSEIPAAAYVITSKDIERSGAQSIPELLRGVPGVQVARTSSNSWAISIRGFNRQFSNKLLVMIDGRTIYTPLFSGVWWDVQDYVLDDIDRIEVIRGPGGTLWGANAVNGVINIITKEARKTQDNYVSLTTGAFLPGIAEYRYGGKTEDLNYYRVYGKYRKHEEFESVSSTNSNDDEWWKGQSGFRYDFRDWDYNKVTLQGDFYTGERSAYLLPLFSDRGFSEDQSGANIMLKWNFPIFEDYQADLVSYIDYTYRDAMPIVEIERITYNVDFQVSKEIGIHNVVSGVEYRYISDNVNDTAFLGYSPDSTTVSNYSFFIQDKISLIEDTLFLTLGSKFDYTEYTNFEYQPNARLLWQVTENHSVWAAASRAVRTPSRGEDSFNVLPLGGGNFVLGNNAYDSEKLHAYEIGYRGDITKNLYIDLAAFYNDYHDLRTVEPIGGSAFVDRNLGFGETYGAEAFAVIGLREDLDLKFGYTVLQQDFHIKASSSDTSLERDERRSPKQQYTISTLWDINKELELDTTLNYVSDLTSFTSAGSEIKISSYTRFDTKLTWKPEKDFEISLIGQNLFDDWHQEFDESLYATASEVPRTVYVQGKYKFACCD